MSHRFNSLFGHNKILVSFLIYVACSPHESEFAQMPKLGYCFTV